MGYYRTCPYCGLHLGHNKNCSCIGAKYSRLADENKQIVADKIEALIAEQSRTAADAANIDDGKVEHVLTDAVSASKYNE